MNQGVKTKPGRTGYWIAVAVFVLGMVATAALLVLFVTGMFGIGDNLDRFVAPGSTEVEFSGAGTYLMFYEYKSEVDGRVYSTSESPPLIELEIVNLDDGGDVPVGPNLVSVTYDVRNYAGVAIQQFRIDEPGTYEISANYADGSDSPEFVLAYGEGIWRGILTSVGSFFAAGFAFCFFTVLAIGIAGITFFRRLQNQRPQETSPAPPNPAWDASRER